ncbi:ATP-binding protein [Leptospira sanjuanensis]|uniref:ATP-binding protein n=1 Tax=Leptospira sanjuanensis TaxID=2879643 RepID=UPI001EE7B232|nr:ATP-binding protein [Leptospira sanjuanensis]MCG6170167.1 putative DNA binding domain-containing protein [Leptospira sanjuanensis]
MNQTKTINKSELKKILSYKEGDYLDVKSKEISPGKLTCTVSAFANNCGGEIYIGIHEKVGEKGRERVWLGFDNIELTNAIIQNLEDLMPLGGFYEKTYIECEGENGLVLFLYIKKTKDILKASNGKVYQRRGAQNLPVEGAGALQRLQYEKGIISFEDNTINCDLKLISDSYTVTEFIIEIVPNTDPDLWLYKQQLIANDLPTVAGVLLFADEPQALLPKRSGIKLLRYQTKDEGGRETLVFDPISIEGAVKELIYSAVSKSKETIESIKKVGTNGLETIQYPEEALHEIITNAVLHRDYSIAADIQIRIFDNRIEIESPGRLPGHVTEENILTEQFARNPKLVRIINKFPDAPNKDVGEGLNTAFEAMNKLRLKEPVIKNQENSVLVILKHESLGSPEQLVLDYLEKNETITNAIARDLTGIRSENVMKRVFYILRDKGLMEKMSGKMVWKKKSEQ